MSKKHLITFLRTQLNLQKKVSNPNAVPSFVQAECQFVIIRSPCLMSGQRFLAILEKLKKSCLVFCVNKKI